MADADAVGTAMHQLNRRGIAGGRGHGQYQVGRCGQDLACGRALDEHASGRGGDSLRGESEIEAEVGAGRVDLVDLNRYLVCAEAEGVGGYFELEQP